MEKEKQENILDKVGIRFHRKLSFKLFTIGFLVVILLIPKMMILSLIQERSLNADFAINEVMSKWSNNQIITGPVLTIPYKERVYDEKDKKYTEIKKVATFLPKNLEITGVIIPENLYRSIYDVVVYKSEFNVKGAFEFPDFEALNIMQEDVWWKQARVQMSIHDLRGISEEIKMDWSGEKLKFSPGIQTTNIGTSGISVLIPQIVENSVSEFELNLDLKGSKNIMFTPLGEKTDVKVSSSWNDPGFIGNFLPQSREINAAGFTASWSVLHFNRNFPQQWTDSGNNIGLNSNEIHTSDFGVELVAMADHYQKNTRSAKYSILIIIVTFIVFFMYEVFSKERIHAFQYIMVGSAITIFYLLLLSISEQLGFNLAYLISTGLVVVLIFFYSRSFISKLLSAIGMALALAACYAFIFVLLQLESYALLAGSIGLFALLALLMFFTRKINWYKE